MQKRRTLVKTNLFRKKGKKKKGVELGNKGARGVKMGRRQKGKPRKGTQTGPH